jgi:hypothetical protein
MMDLRPYRFPDRSYKRAAIHFRSAVICQEIFDAAFARDLPAQVAANLRLRTYITDVVDPFFGSCSDDVLLELDAVLERLMHIIAAREGARAS